MANGTASLAGPILDFSEWEQFALSPLRVGPLFPQPGSDTALPGWQVSGYLVAAAEPWLCVSAASVARGGRLPDILNRNTVGPLGSAPDAACLPWSRWCLLFLVSPPQVGGTGARR